jgi:hypothetical protein
MKNESLCEFGKKMGEKRKKFEKEVIYSGIVGISE